MNFRDNHYLGFDLIGVHRRSSARRCTGFLHSPASLALIPRGGARADYPSRPVRLIVPLAAGGGMDTVARGIALKLTDSLGQTVVVDNRGGGGGSIGAELVAAAAPDGYTLIMMSATSVIHPMMYKARYETLRDFSPISQVTTQPYVIVVNPARAGHVGQGADRLREGKSRQAQLRLLRQRQPHTPRHRAVQDHHRHAHGPHPVQGHRRGLPGPARGQHPADPREHHFRPAAREGAADTGARRDRVKRASPRPSCRRWRKPACPDMRSRSGTASSLPPARHGPSWTVSTGRSSTCCGCRRSRRASRPTAPSPSAVRRTQFAAHVKAERDKWAKVIKQTGIRGD